ncbi:MAG: protein kinase domain-containing protein, partial [Candidatus Saccharimonadales bacterium]
MYNRSGVLLDHTGRLADILDDYLRQAAAGAAPSKQSLLAEHPEIAKSLEACLASLDWIRLAAREQPARTVRDTADTGETETGKTLGDFRLLREIGRGGMGVVYEAEQRSLGRRVALKILPFAGMLDPRQRQRFQNEAHAAAQLDHPNIINVIGVGCERGVYYYAMRLVEGPTLADVVRQLREARRVGQRFPQGVAELAACAPSSAGDEDTTLTRPPTTPHDAAAAVAPALVAGPLPPAVAPALVAGPLPPAVTPALAAGPGPQDADPASRDTGDTPAPPATDNGRADASTWASRPGAG